MLPASPRPTSGHARTLARASTLALVAAWMLLAACGEASAPDGPGEPALVAAASSRAFAGEVGGAVAAPLVVRVTDSHGRAVPDVEITFAVTRGQGASVTPTLARTNAEGSASARVALGTVSGELEVTATAPRIGGVRFSGIAQPGPLAKLTLVPRLVQLRTAGDAVTLRVDLQDRYGNTTPGGQIAFTSLDPTVFTAEPTGLVRAVRSGASARVVAASGERADTALVSVSDPALAPCAAANVSLSLAPGQVAAAPATTALCVRAAADSAEYVLVPFFGTTDASTLINFDVTPSGLAAPLALVASERAIPRDDAPVRDEAFDRRLRAAERSLLPQLKARAATGFLAATAPMAEGQTVRLNTNAQQACTSPELRTGRVVAITARTVIVADTANPPGGFTDAEYRAFGVAFDTLVHPLDVAAFGEPADMDGNGRAVVFFTRAVNELSPASSSTYVGGYFWSRDYLGQGECAGSNEREMFYMLVPDPDGQVQSANGVPSRTFAKTFVDSLTIGVLAHEYQHLINASRRLFVNHAPVTEEAWLNEALSHVAEELLFYRVGGAAPLRNLGAAQFVDARYATAFGRYAASNFSRLRAWMQRPELASPFSDDLGTGTSVSSRGASWSYLRYLSDQYAPGLETAWYRLVNSQTSGFANLRDVFGVDPLVAMRDWSVAMYADDFVPGVTLRQLEPSWDFRGTYAGQPPGGAAYPLATRTLRSDVRTTIQMRAGGVAYLRFAASPGRDLLLQFASGGLAPPSTMQLSVVRVR